MTAFCKGKKEDCSLTEFHWHWNVPGASSCQPQAPKDRSASHQKLQQAPEEYQEGLDISTGSVPPIILCICHCHLRPWFAVFSYLWVTSHHQKKRRERVNWSRGKVPQKRRKKKAHRYTIPSSFHLQRERKFWLDLENMKTSETPLWKQVAG